MCASFAVKRTQRFVAKPASTSVHLKVIQQGLERRTIKPGVLRLEHEVVRVCRLQELSDSPAGTGLGTALHGGSEIRAPFAEVVIDVNDRDSALPRLLGKAPDLGSGARSCLRELRRPREIEGVDDVHEDERRFRAIAHCVPPFVRWTVERSAVQALPDFASILASENPSQRAADKQTGSGFMDDDCATMAAALA